MSQGRPNQPISKQPNNGWAKLGLSCLSAAAAETATYPVDAIKTQLQLQRATKPAGAVNLARQVLKSHSLAGLYAGLSPAVLRHFFYTGQSPQPGSGPSYTVTSPGLRTTHAAHYLHVAACCEQGTQCFKHSMPTAPAEPHHALPSSLQQPRRAPHSCLLSLPTP